MATKTDKAVVSISFEDLTKLFKLPVSIKIESIDISHVDQCLNIVISVPDRSIPVNPSPTQVLWPLRYEVSEDGYGGLILSGFTGSIA